MTSDLIILLLFVSDPQIGPPPGSDSDRGELSEVLALLQDPVLIGSVGALLWFLLMVAAVYLFKRHSKTGQLIPGHGRFKGVFTQLSEDSFSSAFCPVKTMCLQMW